MKCEICKKEFKRLGQHLRQFHMITDYKKYYDDYLKKEGEGICLECGKQTNFIGLSKETKVKNYYDFCSVKCLTSSNIIKNKKEQKFLKKFGTKNPFQSKIVQEKYKRTVKENNTKNPNRLKEILEKSRKTNLEKRKIDNIFRDVEYIKKCTFKKLGVDNYSKTHQFREFARKNMIQLRLNKNEKIFSPIHGKNEKNVYNNIQPQISYQLLEDQEIGGLFPDWMIEKVKAVIEYDELWHLRKCYKKHDCIKDEYYISKGYMPIHIKESDWFEDKELQIIKVQETIKFLEQVNQLRN